MQYYPSILNWYPTIDFFIFETEIAASNYACSICYNKCCLSKSQARICCQTPQVASIAPKNCTGGFFNMLNPNLTSDLLPDHSSNKRIYNLLIRISILWIFHSWARFGYQIKIHIIFTLWYINIIPSSELSNNEDTARPGQEAAWHKYKNKMHWISLHCV